MAKKKEAGYKKCISLLYIVISLILVYFLCSNGLRIYEQRKDTLALQQQRDELLKEKETLSKEVQLLNDDDYVTRYARDNYIFSKDGEEVIKLPDVKE